jgi:hypothetical protein
MRRFPKNVSRKNKKIWCALPSSQKEPGSAPSALAPGNTVAKSYASGVLLIVPMGVVIDWVVVGLPLSLHRRIHADVKTQEPAGPEHFALAKR